MVLIYRRAIQLRFGLHAVLDGRHFADSLAHGLHPRVIDLRHRSVSLQVLESRLAALQPVDARNKRRN